MLEIPITEWWSSALADGATLNCVNWISEAHSHVPANPVQQVIAHSARGLTRARVSYVLPWHKAYPHAEPMAGVDGAVVSRYVKRRNGVWLVLVPEPDVPAFEVDGSHLVGYMAMPDADSLDCLVGTGVGGRVFPTLDSMSGEVPHYNWNIWGPTVCIRINRGSLTERGGEFFGSGVVIGDALSACGLVGDLDWTSTADDVETCSVCSIGVRASTGDATYCRECELWYCRECFSARHSDAHCFHGLYRARELISSLGKGHSYVAAELLKCVEALSK